MPIQTEQRLPLSLWRQKPASLGKKSGRSKVHHAIHQAGAGLCRVRRRRKYTHAERSLSRKTVSSEAFCSLLSRTSFTPHCPSPCLNLYTKQLRRVIRKIYFFIETKVWFHRHLKCERNFLKNKTLFLVVLTLCCQSFQIQNEFQFFLSQKAKQKENSPKECIQGTQQIV